MRDDILNFVVEAEPIRQNNFKETRKDFKKVVDKHRQDVITYQMPRKT